MLCRDWNVVELQEDKSTPNGRVISGAEKLEFELLKTHFKVNDFFTPSHLVKYSWDNHRIGIDWVMARLDWFCTFASSQGGKAKHIK
jgi:dTDP-4-dehydrorhamnose 3,5-epimerase-like enzyme